MPETPRTTCTGCVHISVSPSGCARCHHPARWHDALMSLGKPRVIDERWRRGDACPHWCPLRRKAAG
jgi:hypothetical protein